MNLNENQLSALVELNDALARATATGLLDRIQPYCRNSDSVNDVADAIEAIEAEQI